MIQVNITNNLCLIAVHTEIGYDNPLWKIYLALQKSSLTPLLICAESTIGINRKTVLALPEDKIFEIMNVLGTLKNENIIKNYNINCSNALVEWTKAKCDVAMRLAESGCDIKFFMESGENGMCVCDNSYARKIYALLSCCDIS